jgi:hypothetical protein
VFLRILENLPISRSHKTRAADLAFYYASLRAIRLQNRADWALIGYNGNSFQVATNNETGIARTIMAAARMGRLCQPGPKPKLTAEQLPRATANSGGRCVRGILGPDAWSTREAIHESGMRENCTHGDKLEHFSIRLQTSRIRQEHRPIRYQLPARLSFRQGQDERT